MGLARGETHHLLTNMRKLTFGVANSLDNFHWIMWSDEVTALLADFGAKGLKPWWPASRPRFSDFLSA
jgi:hypothetical protein